MITPRCRKERLNTLRALFKLYLVIVFTLWIIFIKVSILYGVVLYAHTEITMRHKIVWPTGERVRETQAKFSNLCGLLGVVGAIDGMNVEISKLNLVL